jgi:hypothetical protein
MSLCSTALDPFAHSPAFVAFHEGITNRLARSTTVMRAVLIGAYHGWTTESDEFHGC